ncbi:carboxypeptidase-like regulatory domain-containing protein [Bizionia saleffrena]|uniref:Carboxypeptidase-like regulatory domain-containing protein n=1 Tax=Bizionia saleffrena TaxID=291189 RepID=A0A8H2LA97_9FLAO|nr:carboxypeptidase-like regulatory domain-containing protein [Bizionia saleffrena]TYB69078.1 carboxypeptidase-like regulatory domain-containing protein [Bizionia saleffrena]
MLKTYGFIIVLCFYSAIVCAQNITLSGVVNDSLSTPLEYANILAIPNHNSDIRYAVSNEKGTYKLELERNQTYSITVSHLGYVSQELSFKTSHLNSTKNFRLKINNNELGEVTINYTPPISVKKDTIVYRIDKFVTGEERKLKDVLKKLPGVEVDKLGNVSVRGKKVTRVLVENKTFFTGSSKMAVNNIPADVVDEIEVLDNYNEVAMLKGLQDSENVAMNIKLKENKKQFAFGDIEAGGSIKKKYVIHPTLFYYSPKTTINTIIDLNNTGVKSFTFRDYLEFEGGLSSLINSTGSYSALYQSDVGHYLKHQDFTERTSQFGAMSVRQSLSEYLDISGYVITSKAKTSTKNNTENQYNFSMPFVEYRETNQQLKEFFTIGKLKMDYKPSLEEDFTYSSVVKLTDNTSSELVTTQSTNSNNTINGFHDVLDLQLTQNIQYTRKLSKKHIATLEATYAFANDKPFTNWRTNQKILQGLIPLQDDNYYSILQSKKVKTHTADAIFKDYWSLNSFNHLYSSIGVNTVFSHFKNEDVQQLTSGAINNFDSAGFGNDFNYSFINTFLGVEYKFLVNNLTVKPALFYHFYNWSSIGALERFTRTKNLLLPQLTAKLDLKSKGKFNFSYKLNAVFPEVNNLAYNFILSRFNSVFKGNPELENTLYHTVSLRYHKFSLYRKLNVYAGISLNKRIESNKLISQLEGIEQFNTIMGFKDAERSWLFDFGVEKKLGSIKYKLKSKYNYFEYFQIVNAITSKNTSQFTTIKVSAETAFKNYPNIEIGYSKAFNHYNTYGVVSKYENDGLFTSLEYDFLNGFIFNADYSGDHYRNINQKSTTRFYSANASLFYQLSESPWGFEVSGTNLFNTPYKQSNNATSFVTSDSKTFILPRIILFKIAYKL